VRRGGQMPDEWMEPPRSEWAAALESMASRAIRFMWTAAMEAGEQAKLDQLGDRYRIGVVLGHHGETAGLEDLVRIFRASAGDGRWDPARPRQGYGAFASGRRKGGRGAAPASRVCGCF